MSWGLFSFKGRITVVEKNTSDDMIYNWRNELRSNKDGVVVVASSQAAQYKAQGYNKSEVVELLAADQYDIDLAKRVASKLFDSPATTVKETVQVAVVPTKYDDCVPVIEKSLEKYSAKEFVKRLCTGSHSIVKTDDKGIQTWLRAAELAKINSNGRVNLHAALKPWVEEALLNSVLVAESEKPEVKTASRNKYIVSNRKGTVEVDLLNATSTGEKFTKGNYADFGLADEYMVGAANSVSPYQRLKRALKD
jgi:hypothetical protein